MFELIISSILIVVILTPCGYIFSRKNTINITSLSSKLIYGIILISFISLILNFFVPLNPLVNTILLIIPAFILFKKFSYFFSVKFFQFIIINAILVFLLVAKSNVYRPDAMLYHLPYINILNEEKIIFGLSNLHFRFGHISIVQYFSAFFNNFLLSKNAIVLSIAIIASSVIINFSSQVLFYLRNKKFNFHFFYLFSILIFIVYKMNRYSEYGNDAPTHFLFFFLISEIIKCIDNEVSSDNSNNFILSIFISLNKITMAFSIFLPFIFLKKENIINIIKSKKFYFGTFFLVLWIFKNIIVTGCLVYPVSKLCLTDLKWTNINQVSSVASENEAWTKSWPDFKNKNNISQNDYSKNFNWLKTWSKSHLNKIIKILLPYIIFLTIIYIFLYQKYKNKEDEPNIINKKKYLILIILMFIFSIIWFLKVPVYRYGYSYFICLFSLIFSYLCTFANLTSKDAKKFFGFFLVVCFLAFLTKNSMRIIMDDKINYNESWPRIIFLDKSDISKVDLQHFHYYKSKKECGYGFAPCTHYTNENLNSKKYLNYKFIFFN